MCVERGYLSQKMLMIPANFKQAAALPDCFNSPIVNKYSFCSLPSATFFCNSVLFVGDFSLK